MAKYSPLFNRFLDQGEIAGDDVVEVTASVAAMIAAVRPDQRIIVSDGVVVLETLPSNTAN